MQSPLRRLATVAVIVTLLAVGGCSSSSSSANSVDSTAAATTPLLLKTEVPSGHITLDFSAFSPATRPEAEKIANEVIDFYQARFGAPWHNLHLSFDFQVQPGAEGEFQASDDACHQQTPNVAIGLIADAVDYIDDDLPHELAHAWLGCGDGVGRFSEAQAETFSQLFHRAYNLTDHDLSGWPTKLGLSADEYRQASQPDIGVPAGTFQSLVALGNFRYNMLASALRLYEEAHPGFLRKQYQAMYTAARQDELTHGYLYQPSSTDIDGLAIGRTVDPAFGPWLDQQPIFAAPPMHDQLLAFMATPNHIAVIAIKRNILQEPWVGLAMTATFTVAGHPELDDSLSCTTDENGVCFRATRELDLRSHHLPPTTVVVVKLDGGGLSATYTFHAL
ncbi:MAG TPA: hypothetical protein VLI05_00030 [Candidatus Saccharimonadia bacterium]|nr:hypothetical protein [Candidatus Saccharimonadia bacterium]